MAFLVNFCFLTTAATILACVSSDQVAEAEKGAYYPIIPPWYQVLGPYGAFVESKRDYVKETPVDSNHCIKNGSDEGCFVPEPRRTDSKAPKRSPMTRDFLKEWALKMINNPISPVHYPDNENTMKK